MGTNVVGVLAFDEILFEEEPHRYTFRGKPYNSVTQAMRLGGLGDDFSKVSPERMEYAQRRGNMVHTACQYYTEGDLKLDSLDPAIRGYVDAYILFTQDCPVKPIAVEQKLVHIGLALAGRPDLVGFMRGQRVVIDWKTSQHMSKSMGVQTAGYKILWNACHPTQPIRERYGLRLEKNGKYKLFPHEDYEDELAFRDVLAHSQSAERMQQWMVKYAR